LTFYAYSKSVSELMLGILTGLENDGKNSKPIPYGLIHA
jgi:hypothetical protein